MSKNKLLIILCITILALVMIVLGIPYVHWGFVNDDFGNISHCFIKSYKDLIKFFYEGNIECLIFDSKAQWSQNFICGLYRPMSFIYYLPQAYFFKSYAYGYFLVTVLLHAINAMLIFYVLSQFANLLTAFLLALYFAFHPSLVWLGWISAQTYYWELLVLIFIALTLKSYLDTKNIFYYLTSCFLYLLNIYLKEATIILPIWIIAAVYTYQCEFHKNQSTGNRLKQSLFIASGFWIVSIFYLITRAIIFPINTITSQSHTQFNFALNLSSFIARQKSRLFDFVTYASDLCGLRLLPQNNQLIKGFLIILILSSIFWLFFKNTKKRILLFLIFSILIFSWPALMMQYQPRYLYMSLAFLTLFFGVLITFTKNIPGCEAIKKSIIFLSITLIILNALFLTKMLKQKEFKLKTNNAAFHELTENDAFKEAVKQSSAICLFNIHPNYGVGVAPAMWLFAHKKDFPVYCYDQKPDLKDLAQLTDKRILFITWDYENSKFKIVN